MEKQTELALMKEAIEDGDSIIEAFEQVDLDKMRAQGNEQVAEAIETTLALVGSVLEAAGVE